MWLTLGCIAVVFFTIFVVGMPVRWLLAGCKPLTESEWVQAPFVGVAVIIVVLQNLVYFDVPVGAATPYFWGAVLLLWLWWCWRGGLGPSLKQAPLGAFGVMLAVYLFHGLGLLLVGASYYVGRAWWDQFGYVSFAQFLIEEPFSTELDQIGNRPWLNSALFHWKVDRHGQSVVHAFLTATIRSDAKTLFEPFILLSPALTALAVYGLCRRFELPKWRSLMAAAAAALLPSVTLVHLESFLSHALATPFLLLYPVVVGALCERVEGGRLVTAALLIMAITHVYVPFWVLAAGVTVLSLGVAAVRHEHRWQLLACAPVLLAAPLILIPLSTKSFLDNIQYLAAGADPELNVTYPWAFQLEGLNRVWLGDLAEVPSGIWGDVVSAIVIAVTGLACGGLLWAVLAYLWDGRRTFGDPERLRSLVCLLSCAGLLVTPLLVVAKNPERSYAFYKLLLSVSPLLAFGLALWPTLPQFLRGAPARTAGSWWGVGARGALLLVLVTVLAAGAVGTTDMVLASTKPRPNEEARAEGGGWRRHNGHLLLNPAVGELEDMLEELRGENLLIASPHVGTDRWSLDHPALVNAWLTYFARHNRVWLGFPYFVLINDVSANWNLSLAPQTAPIVNLSALPDDLLVLSPKSWGYFPYPPGSATEVWSNSYYVLWRPQTNRWVVPVALRGAEGVGDDETGQPWFWIGEQETVLEVVATRTGSMLFEGELHLTSDLPAGTKCRVRITTVFRSVEEVTTTGGRLAVKVPVRAGKNALSLRVLDAPSLPGRIEGEPQISLVGVQGLTVKFLKQRDRPKRKSQ